MRRYELFHVKEEVAHFLYGREQKFVELIFQYSEAPSFIRRTIEGQIDYLCEPIDVGRIGQDGANSARLYEQNGRYFIDATGHFEEETILFERLRKTWRYILAVELQTGKYGWLNPLKKMKIG